MTATMTPNGPDYTECRGCLGYGDYPGSDCGPCSDCGSLIHLDDSAYAIDSGCACVPCGEKRYGDELQDGFIPGALPPAADSRSYALWLNRD